MSSHNQPTLESDAMARILRRGWKPDIVLGTQNLTQATTDEVISFLVFTDPTALGILARKDLKALTGIYDALIQTITPAAAINRFEELASLVYFPGDNCSPEEFKKFQARVKEILNPDPEKLAA